jgi:hypothetical protein
MPAAMAQVVWWASVIAGLILIGFLLADFSNPGTGLSEWWRRRRRVFEPTFYPASEIRDGAHLNVPYFSLMFLKRTRDTAIELMLYEHIQFSINKLPVPILKIGPKDYVAGEIVKVPIATIPRDSVVPRAYWGTDPQKNMLVSSGNLVEIRVIKRRRFFPIIQSYGVFISTEGAEETGNRYHYLQEDRHVFAR